MSRRSSLIALALLGPLFLNGCSLRSAPATPPSGSSTDPQKGSSVAPLSLPVLSVSASSTKETVFAEDIVYRAPTTTINSAIAADVDIKKIQNLHDMEKAYGFTFSPEELAFLAKNKFVEKDLTNTTIRPFSGGDNVREFNQLYAVIAGSRDYKARTSANALFYSSDVFFHTYNNLYTQLLKEMENVKFYPEMKSLTYEFYHDAERHLDEATTDADKQKWKKVRNYFAVPYAIFENVGKTLTSDDYMSGGEMRDPNQVQAEHTAEDQKIDTYERAATFIKNLRVDAESEQAILADLKKIYDPQEAEIPAVFAEEYAAYANQEQTVFKVDFTQFTPRGAYTSSSLRRQYFRGMKWYIMLPFFVKSPTLTNYAFAITQLLAEDPVAMKSYNTLESTIHFLVGTSDDLMPVDYLQALASAKGASDPNAMVMQYLVRARNPMIKDLAAEYPTSGTASSSEVLLKTKGLRFFSGKFILDSYWTGFLTQGDEAIRKGYTQKLPPMASSLEVMTLLGSDYAKSQIPKLDFYSPSTSAAINQAIRELQIQTDALTEDDWSHNIYFGWLRTIKSLFSWQKAHRTELPAFMQSTAWEAKTLMTAAAWWTELRHATILYAKQSFAEMGAGGDDSCDLRNIPAPPKAYVEPQLEAYARLSYLAKRTNQGLHEQGFELANFGPLERFITLMDDVQSFTKKELQNTTLKEASEVRTRPDPNYPGKVCKESFLKDGSEWEALRLGILDGLQGSKPVPVEGPVLDAKDRRVALVADVHTGGDATHPPRILYEGVGVPRVIFTAVEDVNGPRLTIGFVSSQYEFTESYGGKRLTDEDWQKKFYEGNEPYSAFEYTEKSHWPSFNAWYDLLVKLK